MLVQNIQLELIRPPSGIIRCACGTVCLAAPWLKGHFASFDIDFSSNSDSDKAGLGKNSARINCKCINTAISYSITASFV
jgi:hypothetical protein